MRLLVFALLVGFVCGFANANPLTEATPTTDFWIYQAVASGAPAMGKEQARRIGYVGTRLSDNETLGRKDCSILVGKGPALEFGRGLMNDQNLKRVKTMMHMECIRKGLDFDPAKVRRIRFSQKMSVKDGEEQVAIFALEGGVPTLTFLVSAKSNLWKLVKPDEVVEIP